jgi:hypothetical protein
MYVIFGKEKPCVKKCKRLKLGGVQNFDSSAD